MATTKKKTVYGLFVGINKYVASPLNCCVSDVTNTYNLLKADDSIDLKGVRITDEDATKDNIVAEFRNHLGRATKDDIALFFYAGHGVPELADPNVWKEETDGRLEGIACYFKNAKTDNFILADKEMRFLLNELYQKTKTNIVTVFDCCHSGDNTRNVYIEDPKTAAPKPRFLSNDRGEHYAFPQRKYENFVFSSKIKAADIAKNGIEALIPSTPHIQMAAAESNEPALEANGTGIFSAAFQDVLKQSNGFVSYRNLHSRVQNRMRLQYSQRPKLFAPSAFETLKNGGFLGKDVADQARFASLTFTPKDKTYRVNRGVQHGVQSGVTEVLVEIDGKILRGTASKVDIDVSTVKFDDAILTTLNKRDHNAVLDKLATRQIKLFVDLEGAAAKNDLKKVVIEALDDIPDTVFIADSEDKSDYVLRSTGTEFYLTKPSDAARPLLQTVLMTNPNLAIELRSTFKQMANWHFLTDLENKAADALKKDALKVEVFTVEADGSEKAVTVSDTEGVKIQPVKNTNGKWGRSLKIKLTNTSGADMYVGAFIHGAGFSVNKKYLLADEVVLLTKGESRWLRAEAEKDPTIVKMFREQFVYWYNWAQHTDVMKFVFSPQNFEATAFSLDALPAPLLPSGERAIGNHRGVGDDEDEEPAMKAWNAKNIAFHSINPDFNKVADDDKKAMKDGANTSFFGKKLY